MTHGRAAYSPTDERNEYYLQTGLEDVPVQKGLNSLPGFRWASYGWKRATMLARDGDATGTHADKAHDNNADTIALFGSGESIMVYK